MASTSSSVYRKWVFYCTVGELLGFGAIPVLGGAIAYASTGGLAPAPRALLLYAVAAIGGLGEGAVLAAFQWHVLRERFPQLQARRWILSTAVAASAAWMLGYLAPTLDDLIGITAMMQIAIWIPAGVVMLFSIGTAQAFALKGAAERPGRWIVANVLGWLLGLPWTFVLPALLPETAPLAAWVAAFVVAGVLMGTTVGLVTGVALVRLVPAWAASGFHNTPERNGQYAR
jgi:hypothetical protein